MPKKTFVLVRHAHRDTDSGREKDNGLSAKGRDQAKEFRDAMLEMALDQPAVFLSSPKKRCVETLEPLAKKMGSPVEIDKLLDEQSHGESYSGLERRIDLFIAWVQRASVPLIIASSHGDWIPAFMEKAASQVRDFRKGEWVCLEVTHKGPWKAL